MSERKPITEKQATPAPQGYAYVIQDGLEDAGATFLAPGIHLWSVEEEDDDCFEVVTESGEHCFVSKEQVAVTREGALATLRAGLQAKKEELERQQNLVDAALSGDCLVYFFDAGGEQQGDPVAL